MSTKISIITVCFNSEKTIEQTIKSVLNQTFKAYEYIIIDGNSTDTTMQIVESYSNKFKDNGIQYKYISEKDNGIYDAMNKGIKMATGELIGIINSDDWYEDDALQNISGEYERSNADLIYGLLRRVAINDFPKDVVGYYQGNGYAVHPTVFIKKQIYEQYGYFNTQYKFAADTELLIRISKQNIKVRMIEKIIANFRLYVGSSYKYEYKTMKEDSAIKYKYGLINYKSKIINDLYLIVKIFVKKFIV